MQRSPSSRRLMSACHRFLPSRRGRAALRLVRGTGGGR